ncbi:MAG: hypothetical protein CSYNP_03333 [Syntrophus sp. SKADARSKE-3]|nr:hypothetical protein [Syntrophus sp. SKADARSKE-3]
MLKLFTRKILWLVNIGLILSLLGCVTLATDRRKEGFDTLHKGFASLPEAPSGLHEVITLREVKIHIVGNRSQFNWDVAAAYVPMPIPATRFGSSAKSSKAKSSLIKRFSVMNLSIF